ncbi:MAG: hypothetical protein ACT4OU_06135 [Hyphomicrobium sp.]
MPSRALNRLLWIGMFIAIAVLGSQTYDSLMGFFARVGTLEVHAAPEDDAVVMTWRGQIEAPMADRISEAFAREKGAARTIILSLSSPGGSLDQGAEVVRLLAKIKQTHRLETIVERDRVCASMCVPVYLQGQRRTASAGANFMFHDVSFRDAFSDDALDVPALATASATDRLFARYFAPAGVPKAWIAKVRAEMKGGEDVWKSARQLLKEDAGIVQETF